MRSLVFALSLIFGFAAHAQVNNLDTAKKTFPEVEAILKAEATCYEEAESNMEMNMCAMTKYEAADQLLSLTYETMIAELDKEIDREKKEKIDQFSAYATETKKRLVASQNAWLPFRDANCTFQAVQMLNGSGESLVISKCLGRMTIDRVIELMDMNGSEM